MKKLKILCIITACSSILCQPCHSMFSPTEKKLQKFIVLAARSPVVSTERCVQMLKSYLTLTPTRDQILEVSEYFKYFIYTLYPRNLNMRDYNTLFMFFKYLESFGLPEQLRNSTLTALYNLTIT